jgi:hypothetical protein
MKDMKPIIIYVERFTVRKEFADRTRKSLISSPPSHLGTRDISGSQVLGGPNSDGWMDGWMDGVLQELMKSGVKTRLLVAEDRESEESSSGSRSSLG